MLRELTELALKLKSGKILTLQPLGVNESLELYRRRGSGSVELGEGLTFGIHEGVGAVGPAVVVADP